MSDGQHGHHAHPPPGGGGLGGGQECVVCPVCVLLQAVSSARPEVTRHLVAAGRELTLALQALLEQQMQAQDESAPARGGGLERIVVE